LETKSETGDNQRLMILKLILGTKQSGNEDTGKYVQKWGFIYPEIFKVITKIQKQQKMDP